MKTLKTIIYRDVPVKFYKNGAYYMYKFDFQKRLDGRYERFGNSVRYEGGDEFTKGLEFGLILTLNAIETINALYKERRDSDAIPNFK